MAHLKADISPSCNTDAYDPSPDRHPYLTPQSQWSRRGVYEKRFMQRTLFLGYTKFKITAREPGGQAELLRMLFHYAGIPFQDELLAATDWKSLMCKTPYGNLPVLWMDHKAYGEMNAIIHFLAHHLMMLGCNEKEELLAESILQQVQDLKESETLQKAYEELQVRADDNVEQIFEVILPSLFQQWEGHLQTSNSSFFLPSGLSLADMAVYDLVHQHSKFLPIENLLINYKLLRRHMGLVNWHPRLASYFSRLNPVKLYE